MAYEITPRLTAFLISAEGERLNAYKDTKGIWTIDVGHTSPSIHEGLRINQETSRLLLARDIAKAADAVERLVNVQITATQRDALIALTFNIGVAGFTTSTVLGLVNARNFAAVPDAFRMWNKETIKGVKVVNKGLVNRHEAEVQLWMST